MRVRVSLRAFHALFLMKKLFNPIKYRFFTFQLFFHKLLRYLIGLLLLLLFILNMMLLKYHPLYTYIFMGQSAFYILAAIGFLIPAARSANLVNIPFYFFLVNYASLIAFIKSVFGEKQITWEPRKG